MSSPPAKRRAAGAVPSWQDKLEKLNRLLRQKSDRWKSHLRPNSSVEDVLQAALAQVERQSLQVQVLQSKLRQIEARRADSPKSVSTPTSDNDRKSPTVKKEEQSEIPRFPFLFPNLDISTESVEAAMSQMNSLLYPGPQSPVPISKTLHRDLFLLSPIPFFTITTSLHLIDCNDAFAEAFKVYALPNHWSSAGCTRSQMLSMKLSMIDITATFVPSVLQMLCEGIVTALARGQAMVENRVCTAHNGCRFEVDITVWTTYDIPTQPAETIPRPMCVSGLLTKFQPLELVPLKHM